ncbi:MAG: STAS domain-containing protein [Burkholderiaceae bacterium]|nr:MAG: STAS domain-containing protein [Burkholderiaceae bacterium]
MVCAPGSPSPSSQPCWWTPSASSASEQEGFPVNTHVSFPAEATISQAASLKEWLLSLSIGETEALDLSHVEEFDSAGLQLLLAAQAHWHHQRSTLALVNPSPAVLRLVHAYGVVDILSPSQEDPA